MQPTDSLFTTEPGDSVARGAPPIVESPSMQSLYVNAARAADSAVNLLILGEPGVGKKALARWIHQKSRRARRSLVTVRCGAIENHRIDKALFGSGPSPNRGAYPGAFESADGGTVILEEVDALDLSGQVKAMRTIESRQVTRLGTTSSQRIDMRILATTTTDLEAAINAGKFRGDLFFRITGFTLTIPPLRERPEEIEPLTRHFLAQAAHDARVPEPSHGVLDLFRSVVWPRNVSQLREVVVKAHARCAGPEITPEHVEVEALRHERRPEAPTTAEDVRRPGLWTDVQCAERDRIIASLAEAVGNATRAPMRLTRFDLPGPPKK
jgi:two-component system response regulator AtoC